MRALSKGVNKGRCFAMKMIYEAPAMYAEAFAPNQYVAACTNPVFDYTVPAMKVRCETPGHENTASTSIFFDGNVNCRGKYDPNAYGSGYVKGVWNTKYNDAEKQDVDWFYEDRRGSGSWGNDPDGVVDRKDDWSLEDKVFTELVTAFKGWFRQDGWSHLFYAKTEQVAQYNVS